MADLGVSIVSDIAQAALGAGAVVMAGVLVGSVIGAPVVITFASVVAAGFVARIALSYLDDEFELTKQAKAVMVRLEQTNGSWLQRAEQAISTAAHNVGDRISVGETFLGRVWNTGEAVMARSPGIYPGLGY